MVQTTQEYAAVALWILRNHHRPADLHERGRKLVKPAPLSYDSQSYSIIMDPPSRTISFAFKISFRSGYPLAPSYILVAPTSEWINGDLYERTEEQFGICVFPGKL